MTKALVLYHSQQHGNTSKMAEAVAEGLRSEGCDVTLHNANEGRYPIEEYPKYDCVAFGTPDYFSYLAGTLKTFMDDWYIHRNEPGYQHVVRGVLQLLKRRGLVENIRRGVWALRLEEAAQGP